MLLIKQAPDIKNSEITDKKLFEQRRWFLQASASVAATAVVAPGLLVPGTACAGEKLQNVRQTAYQLDEKLTKYKDITTYNNFYEFGSDKRSPAKLAHKMKTRPWTITVEGEAAKPGVYDIDDFIM